MTPANAVHGDAYVQRGGPISNQKVGGATGHIKFPAPEGLISTPTLTLDGPLLEAAFRNAIAATASEEPEASRTEREIHAAIHWYSRAWENSPLHTMTDVLVQLKTSLEALSGSSSSEKGVKVLRTLYAEAALRPGVDELLWEEGAPRYKRTDQKVASGTFQPSNIGSGISLRRETILSTKPWIQKWTTCWKHRPLLGTSSGLQTACVVNSSGSVCPDEAMLTCSSASQHIGSWNYSRMPG